VSVLPATGSAIKMGGVKQAYTNVAPAAGQNISLNATLGVSYGGKAGSAASSLSATFGGKTAPYTYA
jgi:hypothetical protein